MSDFDPHSYSVMIRRVSEDGGLVFKATVKELPHVVEYGDSYEEVYALAIDTISGLHEMADEMGHEFPTPAIEDDIFSGRVTLRMPKSLHRSVTATADIEGVSLNQFLVATIAEKVSSVNFYSALIQDFEKRTFSSKMANIISDIAAVQYTDINKSVYELFNKDIQVQERAKTTEPMTTKYILFACKPHLTASS